MTNRTASFLVDWVLSEILRAFHIRTIGYLHTQGFSSLALRGPLWRHLVRRLLSSAETLVCLSDALQADVTRLAPHARTVSIGNTPHEVPADLLARSDMTEVSDVSTSATDEITVLFLSNFIPEKGLDDFLKLADHFGTYGIRARFLAAGAPVSEEQLAELRATVGDNTKILGPVGPTEKWQLLRRADLLVFPSRYHFEAQPLVIVESMAAGLPVVAFNIGGIGDIITDGVSGRLVQVGDYDGLRRAVHELIVSPQACADMATAAREQFHATYSRDAYTEAWDDALKY
jgi:glycosyltransferase involved in cell wall biosynthesis